MLWLLHLQCLAMLLWLERLLLLSSTVACAYNRYFIYLPDCGLVCGTCLRATCGDSATALAVVNGRLQYLTPGHGYQTAWRQQQSICCFQTFDTATLPLRIPADLMPCVTPIRIYFIKLICIQSHTHAARQIYLSAICNQSRNYCGDSGTHNVIKANAKFFLEIKFVLVFQCTSVLPLATLSYCMDNPIDSHFHAKLLNVLQSIYYLNFHGHQSQPLQLESWIPWITCDLLHCCHSWWTFTQLSALIS